MSALTHQPSDRALEQFLEQMRPRLRSLFVRYRIPVQDTEDILQDALLILVHKWETIREPEGWLMGTLANTCLLYWRDRRRRLYDSVDAAVLDWIAEPEPPPQERGDLRHDLETMIARLPARCRSLLKLRYRFGLEPPELAERLGYRPSSISKVTARCLAAMTRQVVTTGLDPGKKQA